MSSRTRSKRVLRWSPSPDRRLLTQYALAVSALIVISRIALFPWSWRYVDDIYLDGLLWIVCVPSVLLLLFGFRRVFPPGHCHKCGYDLAGKTSGVCPECGETISERPAPEKRHFSRARLGRTGRMLKWAGLISCLLIVQAGAVAAFCELTHTTDRSFISLAGGELLLVYCEEGPCRGENLGWELRPNSDPRWGDFDLVIDGFFDESWLSLPLWILLVVIAIPTAFLFWLDRRRIPSGHCQTCGYELTGNVRGICPECGEMVPPQQSA